MNFDYMFVPQVWINNIPALVQIMAWHRPILTYICITQPQWVTLLMLRPEYSGQTRLTTLWLLIPWLLASPGHQQPWYWLCAVWKALSSFGVNFRNMQRFDVEEWCGIQRCFYVFLENFSLTRLNTLRIEQAGWHFLRQTLIKPFSCQIENELLWQKFVTLGTISLGLNFTHNRCSILMG